MNSFIKRLLMVLGIYKSNTTDEERNNNSLYLEKYQDTSKLINLTAVFAHRLANMSVMDSSFNMPDENKRVELLKLIMGSVWAKRKKIISLALGCGGCAIIPFIQNKKIYFNYVTQDRININRMDGDKIVSALVVADTTKENDKKYYRVMRYDIIDNNLIISCRTVNDTGNQAKIEQWEDVPDMAIANVDRVPFGFMKNPTDNRECTDKYGVPITYGAGKLIIEILECLEDIRKEYKRKKTRLQVDQRVFARDEKGNPIIKDDIFMTGQSEDGNMFNIFDPAIRDSSYYNRLKNLLELLEKSVGTSKGVLTEPLATYENVEAIKAAVRDTWAIVSDIRTNFEYAIKDFLYACDVYANYYNLAPPGKYTISYAWDYSMVEKTSDTWEQMKDTQSIGGMAKAELRAWVTGETIEEAQKSVDVIAKKEPNIQTLLGMSE